MLNDDQMKHVEREQSSLISSGVPNDNPLQFVLCASEILDFQLYEQQPDYRSLTS